MFIATLALSLLLQAPPPPHYQPKLLDPGLHGGRPSDQNATLGDVTPDGRVMVFYRSVFDLGNDMLPGGTAANLDMFRSALQVGTFDPDFVQTSGANLSGFFTAEPGKVVGGETMWGTHFAISDQNDPDQINAVVLHLSPPTLGTGILCPSPARQCHPLDTSCLPQGTGAPLTLAMRPLVGHPAQGANPFPSNAFGDYSENGSYRTYELFMVTTHWAVQASAIACDDGAPADGIIWFCQYGVWQFNGAGLSYRKEHPEEFPPTPPENLPAVPEPILGCRNIKVVVDESVHPHRVYSASEEAFTPLTIGGADGPHIIGTEPSITADGRLIVFHGDGGANLGTNQTVTYVYNETPCSSTGWQVPKSITEMYGEGPSFKEHYPMARFPIREPDENGVYSSYAASDKLQGPYPWVEKDGAFFMSTHTFSWDAPAGDRAVRSSMILCGEITGGYVKHIDDVALNPTRNGGPIDWPLTTLPSQNVQRDTQMQTFFSTGLKPSPWEPFLGEGVPVPTMQAGPRIPILPVWVHRTRLYGEVRLEEADGNYLLYLACNEAFRRPNPRYGPPPYNYPNPSAVDATKTPDTSGRTTRASCSLVNGASFPQEVGGSDTLRMKIAQGGGAGPLRSHENIGFKGQAILFPTAGAVSVAPPFPAHGNKITFQAFVKAMRDWNLQPLKIVTSVGRFELRLNSLGRFIGQVTVLNNNLQVTKTVVSHTLALDPQPDEFDPTAGWRHVAVTFDGDVGGKSYLRIYLDGQLEATSSWNGTSTFFNPITDVYVGPRAGGSTDAGAAVLVLDEVSISSVVRTTAELRRDAFVEQLPSGFEHTWPAQADYPLPNGLGAEDVFWPTGVTYQKPKVLLGRALFSDPILSALSGDPTQHGSTSCATCHEPAHSFAEPNPPSPKALDVSGVPLPFNTPTLINAAFGTVKMFDGRAASLEDQTILPLVSGREMGIQTIDHVKGRLVGIDYDNDTRDDFVEIYNASATQTTLSEVLAMYVRTLNSGQSAFDNGWHPGTHFFPGGGPPNPELTASQRAGRALFFGKARCFACHRGTSFTDNGFHNIHTVVDAAINGLGGITGRGNEIGMLKTPTLRNVEKTGPYFHDGSKSSLEAVVDHYNDGFLMATGAKGPLDRNLLPLGLSPTEKAQLVDFLKALSGSDPQ